MALLIVFSNRKQNQVIKYIVIYFNVRFLTNFYYIFRSTRRNFGKYGFNEQRSYRFKKNKTSVSINYRFKKIYKCLSKSK